MTDQARQKLFSDVEGTLNSQGIKVAFVDNKRPWGGFLVIDPLDSQLFAETYFSEHPTFHDAGNLPRSAKILVVAPHKRLSWQYHERRNEIWQIVSGTVGVVTSTDNIENELHLLENGQLIRLNAGIRHRLVGLDQWSLVAEIWEHIDPAHPSNEEDIIRVQDDFGR